MKIKIELENFKINGFKESAKIEEINLETEIKLEELIELVSNKDQLNNVIKEVKKNVDKI